MMRLNEVWQTDPAAGEWRSVTCDCMRLCGGEERVKRLESEQLRNPRHRVSQWPWHVTRGGLTDQGRCASTRRDQLLQPYYLDPHHMSPISDQLCLHHFCTDSGKTEFWGIMAMLPKCLLVTVTETPWHTPVMLPWPGLVTWSAASLFIHSSSCLLFTNLWLSFSVYWS